MDLPLLHHHPLQQVAALRSQVPLSAHTGDHAHDFCGNMRAAVAKDGLGRESIYLVVGRRFTLHVRTCLIEPSHQS